MQHNNSSPPAFFYQLRMVTRFLAIAILLLFLLGLFLPKEYKIERSIIIQAESAQFTDYIQDKHHWSEWMYIQNGTLVLDETKAFAFSINYFSDVKGSGNLSVDKVDNNSVHFFVIPKSGQTSVKNVISWKVLADGEPNTDHLEINWRISGEIDAGLLSSYLAFFANDIAGSNFERSLQQLKQRVSETVNY